MLAYNVSKHQLFLDNCCCISVVHVFLLHSSMSDFCSYNLEHQLISFVITALVHIVLSARAAGRCLTNVCDFADSSDHHDCRPAAGY